MVSEGRLSVLDASQIAHESDLTAEELIARGEKLMRLGRELQVQAARLRDEPPPPERPRADEPASERSIGRNGLVNDEIAIGAARRLGVFTRIQFGETLGLDGAATSKWIARLHERELVVRDTREEDHALVYRYQRELEDEPPGFQLRAWCRKHPDAFDLETVVDALGLTSEEGEAAISELLADQTIAPVTVEAVDDLGEIDKLGGTFFQFVPPIPGGVQGELERRRLASVNADPQVARGTPIRIRTERRNARARSTPGSRQKVINQDRNWERLQAAKQAREEESRARAAREREKPKGRKPKRSRPVS